MSDDRTVGDRDAAAHCYNCSRPPVPGRRWCRVCMDASKRSFAKWRIRQLVAGNCVRCGRPNPDDGQRVRCPACRAKDSANYRARRQSLTSTTTAEPPDHTETNP